MPKNQIKKITFLKMFLLIMFLFFLLGCAKKSDDKSNTNLATGTDGIVINFLQGNPQNNYLISPQEEEPITAVIEVRNKGSYPELESQSDLSQGQIFLSGFDTNIIKIEPAERRIDTKFLQGKSQINPA